MLPVFLLCMAMSSGLMTSPRPPPRRTRLCAAGRMATAADAEVVQQEARAKAVLEEVSDLLVRGDDAGALRTVSQRVGDLLSCPTLPTVAESIDSKTRYFVLSYVEQFSETASSVETDRKRALLKLVEDIKASGTSEEAVDAIFERDRERFVELNLLEHVDHQLATAAKDPGPVRDFLKAIRDRLASELAKAVYGDDAVALRLVLSQPSDEERLSALKDHLQFRSNRRRAPQWFALLKATRDHQAEILAKHDEENNNDIDDGDPALLETLDLLLAELEPHATKEEEAASNF